MAFPFLPRSPHFRLALLLVLCLLFACQASPSAGDQNQTQWSQAIDSLLQDNSIRPFNGVMLLASQGTVILTKEKGWTAREQKVPLKISDQFVIGSISKQITAVLILQAYEAGQLNLFVPIRPYLPNRTEAWLDSITIHQLLNHSSGVVAFGEPLAFAPGSDFHYSGNGYRLLSEILEEVSDQPFENLAMALFTKVGMERSGIPGDQLTEGLVPAYYRNEQDSLAVESNTFDNNYLAAGLFISTAEDLLRWNRALHHGQLLADSTYQRMTSPSAFRDHPIWGAVGYGYGIQIEENGPKAYGHSGYAPGYLTINYHFPDSDLDLIVLENLDWRAEDFNETFAAEKAIRKWVEQALLIRNSQ